MDGRFTDEELAIAKSVDLCAVAESLGYGKVVEALNESLGVVYRDVASTGKIVVIGRP